METLSVLSERPFSLESIGKILSAFWRVENSTGAVLAVHGTGSRAYLHIEAEFTEEKKYRLLMDYSDVELAKDILLKFANDNSLVIDNDFGTILPGNEFVAKIESDMEWNWRKKVGGWDEASQREGI